MAKPATIAQKIIARAAGVSFVTTGEIVTAKVDLAFAHDSSGPRRWAPQLERLGVGLWDPAKVAIVTDHYVPATDADSAAILKIAREFAATHDVKSFFDMVGICHLVLPERGLIRPGAFVAGGDSHSPTGGAFGAYVAGYGATDMIGIVATGETWLAVPETIRIELEGDLPNGVVAKDLMLMLCRELGMDNAFRAFEFAGSTVAAMEMHERMVLSNMATELGGEVGIIAPDDVTFAFLRERDAPVEDEDAARALASDPDALCEAVHRFDATALSPQVAAPHSPENTRDVGEFADVRIDQAYIGACVGAKLSDLHMVAQVLKGRQVASGVRLLIAPASLETMNRAASDGTLETLTDAGALIMPTGCGACAGMGAGVLADGETCISSTNRNFQGRMGHSGANVYLGSPYTTAATAVAGRIADPRTILEQI
ncbi:3-isopropylmalate dehydratase large subunit [Parasphingopyxis algicola]|uniref:3-isopropylmalate dehydratase large subunit n=1 Tax=Parasphingopyxis algicola TaxID=2026624 RepID=UPI0015A3C004|nr:3-isopropylmalate dehydratase large subunit [Parasphingopyxis algicola]QLC26366.1 3-isopropylmalate dehydratase large subunit [Parasphingopyxis algicola]